MTPQRWSMRERSQCCLPVGLVHEFASHLSDLSLIDIVRCNGIELAHVMAAKDPLALFTLGICRSVIVFEQRMEHRSSPCVCCSHTAFERFFDVESLTKVCDCVHDGLCVKNDGWFDQDL